MRPARLRQSTHVGVGVVLLGLSAVVVVVHTSGPTAALVIVGASIGSAALYLAGSSAAASPETAPGTEQQLIAHVSHELRTPLTSVIGLLELLAAPDNGLHPEETMELLGMANSEAQHMMHLVANLHSVSRLARHTLEPACQPVDLVALTERVLARFPDVGRRTFLPKGEPLAAWADPQLATQIIANLVQNTRRYAPEGEIEVAMERADGQVILSVADDGPGIDEDAVPGLFVAGASQKGLGIGLSLSRQLARAMGGDVVLTEPRRRGATFSIVLPAAQDAPEVLPKMDHGQGTMALPPRSRLLVDMATVLSERSLDRTVAGLRKLYVDLLGAVGGMLLIPAGPDLYCSAGSFGDHRQDSESFSDPILSKVMRTARPFRIEQLDSDDHEWGARVGGRAALLLPVLDLGVPVGVLAISWAREEDLPDRQGHEVAHALAQIAAFAIHRSNLVDDIAYERVLRASVMESLPIAISVFAGDPLRVVDWNRRERRMLGIADDMERPSDLDESQERYQVRFADGTPLTVENAPVTEAIRTGRSAGPFLLVLRRADGTEITTRTYCAPFFDDEGLVAGAVVTSEELDGSPSIVGQARLTSAAAET